MVERSIENNIYLPKNVNHLYDDLLVRANPQLDHGGLRWQIGHQRSSRACLAFFSGCCPASGSCVLLNGGLELGFGIRVFDLY